MNKHFSRNLASFFYGFLLFLPSNIYLSLVIFQGSLGYIVLKRLNISRVQFNVIFSLAMLFPIIGYGVIIGNDEALSYLARVLACIVVVFFIFSYGPVDENSLKCFVSGMVSIAVLNAAIVIATAIYPQLYELLKLSSFSGFDKEVRHFRSPGLFRGYDTSGYFMIISLAAFHYLPGFFKIPLLIKSAIYILIAAAVFLSSRSSILMLLGVIMLFFVVEKNLALRTLIFRSVTVFAIFIASYSVFFVNYSNPIEWINANFYLLSDVNFDTIYAISSEGYIDHYDFEKISMLPVENNYTPDNFFFRSSSALGIMGSFLLLCHILTLIYFGISMPSGDVKSFACVFSIIFIFANFKNNYFFFLSYYTILIYLVGYRFSAKVKLK